MLYKVRTVSSPINVNLILPGSEDITYRALLLSVLGNGVSEISGLCLSHPIKTLIEAFHQLGIVVQLDTQSQSCIIAGSGGNLPLKQATLWCENAKIIAYFLIALCAASPGAYHLDGSPILHTLFLNEFLTLLHQQGVDFIPNNTEHMPFTILGTESFEGGEVNFTQLTDSHLVSAMLMISPHARQPFVLNTVDLINEEEIDLTCSMMAEFGVLVHRIHQGQFMVPVPQQYQARDYLIEPDFSLAAYFFAAIAITGGKINIQPSKRASSKQPDIAFLSILEKMGCQVQEKHSGLMVQGAKTLKGIEVGLHHFADTFLALTAIAPFATSPTHITHIGPLGPQESACLSALVNKFKAMDIHIEAGADWIKIFPSLPKSITVNRHDDYRITMTLSIIGLKIPGIIIEDADCITQIYPEFFTLWDKLIEKQEVSV